MRMNASKVSVIGAGLVGSSTAFSLLTQGVCDEILLVDINQERAHGEMMDLRDGIDYLGRNVKVSVGDYKDCGDADIVVITAGPPPKEGQTRLDSLDLSKKIIDSLVGPIMDAGFSGVFLIISNPVDIIAQYVWKLSGLPKNQVLGTGTALDSARLKALIGELVGIDPRSVHAYALGEHGDSQTVPWSRVTVGGTTRSRPAGRSCGVRAPPTMASPRPPPASSNASCTMKTASFPFPRCSRANTENTAFFAACRPSSDAAASRRLSKSL